MKTDFTQTVTGHTLDVDLTRNRGSYKNEALTTLCTDLFLIVIRMREAEDLGEPCALRKLILHYAELFKKNCIALCITSQQIQRATYALVALLDETVLSSNGSCYDYWITNPLQLELFGDTLAGQHFYDTLETMLQSPEKNKEVLKIYYLCLCLGFQGKFKLGNTEEREEIICTLAQVLLKNSSHTASGLSPHGFPTILSADIGKWDKKRIMLGLYGLVGAVVITIWWGILFFLTRQSFQKIADALK